MTQSELFPGEFPPLREQTADELKEKYKKLAAQSVPEELATAREIARLLADRYGSVNIEEVRDMYEKTGRAWTLGNGAGSVFDVGFISCGIECAKREASHGRLIRRWKLE